MRWLRAATNSRLLICTEAWGKEGRAAEVRIPVTVVQTSVTKQGRGGLASAPSHLPGSLTALLTARFWAGWMSSWTVIVTQSSIGRIATLRTYPLKGVINASLPSGYRSVQAAEA